MRRSLTATAALFLALAQAPAFAWTAAEVERLRAGEQLSVEVPVKEGGAVRAAIFVAAPLATVRRVLWAHERYPEFVPHNRTVRMLERHGNRHVVEMVGGQGPVTVAYVAERVLEADRITWRSLSGDVRRNDGYWAFEPVPGGTLVTYQVHLVPNGPVPGHVVAFLQKQALPGLLKAVKKRIEQTP